MRQIAIGFFLAIAACLSTSAWATAQEPDELIIDGETLSLETNPLRQMIRSGSIKIPKADESWTSNWRGYTAKWEIHDNRLLLREINILRRPAGSDEKADAVATNVISDVFPNKNEVVANWFTGTLVLPRGKVVQYVHMGYGSIYERYTILHIKLGTIISREDLTNEQFQELRKQRFSAYRKTSEYAERYKDARKNLSADSAENFLYEYSVEEYMSVEP